MPTTGKAERASTEGKHSAEHPGGKGKDWWGRLLAALVAGALTGGVAWRVNTKEMHARSIELQSSREAAVQALQGRVFDTFAAHVASLIENEDSRKVVLLSALHSNFNEFFDMRPVLETFSSVIKDPTARRELLRLSKRVARRQGQYIKAHSGGSEEHGNMSKTVKRHWPVKSEEEEERIEVGPHRVKVTIKSRPLRYCRPDEPDDLAFRYEKVAERYKDDDDGIIDDIDDQVEVTITLDMGDSETFTVSYMDSPYMDNFWMAHHDGTHGRLAVVVKDIDTIDKEGREFRIELEVLHFPASLFTPTERPSAGLIESSR